MQEQTPRTIDLTTPRDRTVIAMDSGTYRLRSPYDLSIADYATIERLMPEFLKLVTKGRARSSKESTELGTLAKQVCQIGLLEGDVAAIGPAGHVVLADFFFDLCLQNNLRLMRVRDQSPEAPSSLGPPSSRRSFASTAGRRRRGSTTPRSVP